jgi:hypothetical protein
VAFVLLPLAGDSVGTGVDEDVSKSLLGRRPYQPRRALLIGSSGFWRIRILLRSPPYLETFGVFVEDALHVIEAGGRRLRIGLVRDLPAHGCALQKNCFARM